VSQEQKLLHDLLNNLLIITATCEILCDRASTADRQQLDAIFKAAGRMADFIREHQASARKNTQPLTTVTYNLKLQA
jgi:hypothetical protein